MVGTRFGVDRTNQTTTNVPRRTILRGTAGLLALGGVGSASAHDADEDSDVGQGSDLTCTVTFPDQEIGGDTVRVEDFSLPADGYMSIHDISRFSGADVSDVDEIDEIPERDNPICGSVVGITGLISAGEYDELEVDLYTDAAPSVSDYGHFSVQSMEESQPLLAIPHVNETGVDEFVCNDDPPDDGVFFNGTQTVGSLAPVVNDIATVTLESDDDEQKDRAQRLTQLILDGTIAPPDDNDEDDIEEEDDEAEAGEDGEDGEDSESEEDDDEEISNEEDDGEGDEESDSENEEDDDKEDSDGDADEDETDDDADDESEEDSEDDGSERSEENDENENEDEADNEGDEGDSEESDEDDDENEHGDSDEEDSEEEDERNDEGDDDSDDEDVDRK